jgi:hypothetical protein
LPRKVKTKPVRFLGSLPWPTLGFLVNKWLNKDIALSTWYGRVMMTIKGGKSARLAPCHKWGFPIWRLKTRRKGK